LIELGEQVYAMTEKPAFRRRYSLRDQPERATVSISNNIAEGFERGTMQELLTFSLYRASSAGEVRSRLCMIERLPGFADLKSEISDLKSRAEGISRQLRAWAASLQDSEIKGQRYLTDKTRQLSRDAKDRQEFLRELEEIRTHGDTNKGKPS
jgi:four helix bundle protein